MLEGVLERLILDRLGEYVDLPKDSIQVGVWSGEIVLDNVALRPSCLTRLKLPINVRLGRLRRLHVKVPWASLGSSPVKITLEGLHVLARPAHGAQFDRDAALRLVSERKQQQLLAAEQLRALRHWEENNAEEARRQESFGQSLLSKIIANLQIVVRDVHVRYEDAETLPGRKFAAGVIVQEFTALTTDANFEECFVSTLATAVNTYKLLSMRNAAVYWDSNDVVLWHDSSDDAVFAFMQASIDGLDRKALARQSMSSSTSHIALADGQTRPSDIRHVFILEPLSATLHLTLNSRYFEQTAPHYRFGRSSITCHAGVPDDVVLGRTASSFDNADLARRAVQRPDMLDG